MTTFHIGERYTRDQVRAAVGLPRMAGGDWATGYARVGDEVFVFCNIGVAGRTGHDYPNCWVDGALDWFGKTGSTPDQPLISAMVSGAVTTHVFWRGTDRASFTYAGIGVALGIWGERPVEVLWQLQELPKSRPSPPAAIGINYSNESVARFRHGPPPSLGFKQLLAQDGECFVYLMLLEGQADALFPGLTPRATGRSIVKVGISKDPPRREMELNAGFPKGSAVRWIIRDTRAYGSVSDAYNAEGLLLQGLADTNRWLGGEFAIITDAEVDGLLRR